MQVRFHCPHLAGDVELAEPRRHWVVTAYLVRKQGPGDMEWQRN